WRRVMTPAVLGETAYCRDRTDARQLASVPAGDTEDRVIPHAVARLRGGESDCRPMGIGKPVQVGRWWTDGLRDFRCCAVLDRRGRVLQEPTQCDSELHSQT